MKNQFLCTLFLVYLFSSSCKRDLSIPQYEQIAPVAINDENLRVSSFSGQKQGSEIKIHFTTSLEKDIVEIVLMHGSNRNQLCRIKTVYTNGSSNMPQSYSVTDDAPMGNPTYYILKYVTKKGEWGCSNVYSVSL